VVRRFRREGLLFPRRLQCGPGKGEVLWGVLEHCCVARILHNPRYAGAFVFGRTRTARTAAFKTTQVALTREHWQVLIRDAHVGYISWEEFEGNQATLKHNATGFGQAARGSMPREGVGLLQGRVICGRCGARMRVRYQEVEGCLQPYYLCAEEVVRRAASKPCQSVRGRPIDEAISALLLETVAPAAIEVALAVHEEIATRIEQADALRRAQLERARYAAELARRRYLKVDPDNRLVADALEADWNDKLRGLDELQQTHERQRAADQALLDDQARARIGALARDFRRVWDDPRTAPLERKRMVALLIEDVTLLKGEDIAVHVRFRGGRTTSLSVPRPVPIARIRKTRPEVVNAIDELLETCTDRQAAARLNQMGYTNWKGQPFTYTKVRIIRSAYGLRGRFERLRARGMRTGEELARQLGVCASTIHEWGRAGYLRRHLYGNSYRCLYEPIGEVVLVKGSGGRYGSKPPQFITAQPSTQGAI
jgi:hypothetical protein